MCNTPHTQSLAVSENGHKYYEGLTDWIKNQNIVTPLEKVGTTIVEIAENKYVFMNGRLIIVDSNFRDLDNSIDDYKYRLCLND